MLNTNDQAIIERYKKLPAKLRSLIFSDEISDAVFDIGKASKLTLAQINDLTDEVSLVFLGATARDQFWFEVERKLNLTKERREVIVSAVEEKIFAPVKEELEIVAAKKIVNIPSLGSSTLKLEISKAPLIPSMDVQRPSPIIVKQPPPPSSMPSTPPTPPQHYAGKDPYKEPIDEEAPPAMSFAPKPPLEPTKPILPPQPSINAGRPLVSAEPISTPITQPAQPKQVPKILSWEDIKIKMEQTKEPTTPPDAKSALEQALRSGEVAAPHPPNPKEWATDVKPPTKTMSAPPAPLQQPQMPPPPPPNLPGAPTEKPQINMPKYESGKDPYRESIE